MRRRDFIMLSGSAAVAWPFGADAQQPMPVIGWLSSGSLESDNIPARLPAFRRGLSEMGYVEGQNVTIEYRWAEGQYDRFPALAAHLVRLQTMVIVTPGPSQTFAAKAGDLDYSDRLRYRRRPGPVWPRRQRQPAGWQHHGRIAAER